MEFTIDSQDADRVFKIVVSDTGIEIGTEMPGGFYAATLDRAAALTVAGVLTAIANTGETTLDNLSTRLQRLESEIGEIKPYLAAAST